MLLEKRALLFGRWTCLALGFMFFVTEWHYNQGTADDRVVLSVMLTYPSLLFSPFLCLLAAELKLYQQPVRVSHWISSLFAIYGLVFGVTLVQAITMQTGVLRSSKFVLIQLAMMPAWGGFGLILGGRVEGARRVLGWLATGCAVGSLLSGFFWVFLPEHEVGLLERASWPMRMVFLFGFFWFLTHWLANVRLLDWNMMGMLACSIEAGLSLHKPVIFSLGAGLVGFLWLSSRRGVHCRLHMRALKIFLLIIALASSLGLAEGVSHGAVSSGIRKFWYQAVWHVDYDSDMAQVLGDRGEALEHAAAGRLGFWRDALQAFANGPFLGSGFPEVDTTGGSVSIHNGYLDWLLAFGILGTLPVVCIWGSWFRAVLRRRPNANPAGEIMIVAVASYLLAIAAFNLGGTVRLFPNVCYFIAFVSGITFRLAMDPEVIVYPWPGQWQSPAGRDAGQRHTFRP